ncbi:MAG: hypothetical protein WBW32_19840 [Luteibacter sp.]
MPHVQEFIDKDGRNYYRKFVETLGTVAAAKVMAVTYKLTHGNTSGLKSLGAGLAEWRIDWGPGLRIYIHQDGDDLILLLAGSEKGDQQKAIGLARDLVRDYKARKREGRRTVFVADAGRPLIATRGAHVHDISQQRLYLSQAERTHSMALTVDYRETILNRIRSDPDFAGALLDEAATMLLNGETGAARMVMRDLTHGLMGFEGMAKATGTPPKSLHRMLSSAGNPGMDALGAILRQLTRAALHASAVSVHVVPENAAG